MTIATAVTPGVQAMIMAGGRGERLHPLTASRPKPVVSFGGVFRIVDFTLSNCLNSGVGRTSLLTQYKHEELQTYIEHSWSRLWKELTRERLVCLPPREGGLYRGTADAVFQNISELRYGSADFVLILSADHVYQMDYRELLRYHAETDADLTIATIEHALSAAKHYGVIEVDHERRVVGFQEKPSNPRPVPARPGVALVSMGVYVFKREVLMQALSEGCEKMKGSDFGHDIIPSLIGSARVQAYDFNGKTKNLSAYWRDIGTLDNYYEASMDLVRPEPRFDPYGNEDWPSYRARYEGSPQVHARLHTNCRIVHSVMSPGVRIEEGSVVDSSVLMSRVWVGKDARIRRAIIEEGVRIPAGFQIGFDLENDRKNYFVTRAGVVVVSQTPSQTRPTGINLSRPVGARPAIASSAA